MKQRTVKYKKKKMLFLGMLSFICMICLCACSTQQAKKSTLQICADPSLKTELALVGDKFLVTDGKGYDIKYCFDEEKRLHEMIVSGNPCDLLITSSQQLMDQLAKEELISADQALPLMERPMAAITADADASSAFSPQEFFLRIEFSEDNPEAGGDDYEAAWDDYEAGEDDYEETQGPEGYQRYIDVLAEHAEEEWSEDWEERYGGLWIQNDILSIGVLNEDTAEGQCAKALLNQFDGAYDLLETIGLIHSFETREELLEAVQTGEVKIGICPKTDWLGTNELRTIKVFDEAADPVITYYVCLVNGSENRKEAKELMTFLQGKHARRFFEDFGFTMKE